MLCDRNRNKCTSKIARRSSWLGKPTKNISSNLPFLSISGGKDWMLLAVATTNTGEVFWPTK